MVINVKMPTIVGILTFISMINTAYEGLKARKTLGLRAVEIVCSFELTMKKLYNLRANFAMLFTNITNMLMSGIFKQTAKFGQRPCLFHISNIGIKKYKLSKQ